MIRTVSINLGGIVFQIDEDAYESLRNYLDSVTQYYKYQEGRDEIVADIENRFAEIFAESLEKSGFDVISLGDVEEVIGIMGRPEDFDGEGEPFDDEPAAASSKGRTGSRGKILYRDKDTAVLAGVCSGLAAYWGIADPLWLRLAFIATALFSAGTVGVVVYIILWIVVPEARTSSQKLEMKGEPVNLSNLERKFREEIGEAGERLSDFAGGEGSSVLRRIVNGIGKVFGAVAKLAWAVLKIAFVIFVIGIVIAIVASLIAALFSFLITIPLSLKYIFTGVGSWLLAVIGGLLIILIPIAFLVYLPFRLFGRRRVRNKHVTIVGTGLFIVGIIFAGAAASIVASYFSEKENVATQIMVPYPPTDTLNLTINDNEEDYEGLDYRVHFSHLLTFTKKLETASDWVELDIVPSTDGKIYLEQTNRARGRTKANARANAAAISYNAAITDSGIRFDPVFGLGKNKKWRSQAVKLRLKVPEGLIVVPSHDMTAILDDANNSLNAGMYTVAGNRWKMSNGKLEPIDSILSLGSEWSKRNMQDLGYRDFDNIEIKGEVDVEIVQSDRYEVYMIANARTKDEIEVEMDGSTLVIIRDGWHWDDVSIGFIRNTETTPKFYISMPLLEDLSIAGQANVTASDFNLTSLSLDCGGQSTLILENLEVDDLEADMHGQSTLEITGQAENFSLSTSAQSNFDGERFSVGTLNIDMSGQSDAEMVVNDNVEGEVSGQSDLEYWGNPDVDVSVSGQADVDRRD